MKARSSAGALVALCIALGGCTQKTSSPEDEIRALLARAEQAVRDRDADEVKALIDDGYRDEEGRDKRALVQLAAFQFLRQGSLHIKTRLKSVSFPQRDAARASVFAALGHSEISLESLPQIDADIYLFQLDLRRGDDGWQVSRAEWRSATTDDLGAE